MSGTGCFVAEQWERKLPIQPLPDFPGSLSKRAPMFETIPGGRGATTPSPLNGALLEISNLTKPIQTNRTDYGGWSANSNRVPLNMGREEGRRRRMRRPQPDSNYMCGCSPVCKSFFDTHRAAGSFVHVSGLCMRRIMVAGRYGVLRSGSRTPLRTHFGPV